MSDNTDNSDSTKQIIEELKQLTEVHRRLLTAPVTKYGLHSLRTLSNTITVLAMLDIAHIAFIDRRDRRLYMLIETPHSQSEMLDELVREILSTAVKNDIPITDATEAIDPTILEEVAHFKQSLTNSANFSRVEQLVSAFNLLFRKSRRK